MVINTLVIICSLACIFTATSCVLISKREDVLEDKLKELNKEVGDLIIDLGTYKTAYTTNSEEMELMKANLERKLANINNKVQTL